MEPQKNFGPNFLGFTPKNRLFCPTPRDQLATLRKLRLYQDGTPIPAKLWPVHYICSTETTLSRGGEQYLCEVAMQINYWSLIINLWCFVIKFANSSVQPQFPQCGILQLQFPQSDHTPPFMWKFVWKFLGKFFLGHPEYWVKGVFEKNSTQFGQLLPRWPHLQSATPYMASPPCTIFHNPDLKWNIVQQCTN